MLFDLILHGIILLPLHSPCHSLLLTSSLTVYSVFVIVSGTFPSLHPQMYVDNSAKDFVWYADLAQISFFQLSLLCLRFSNENNFVMYKVQDCFIIKYCIPCAGFSPKFLHFSMLA